MILSPIVGALYSQCNTHLSDKADVCSSMKANKSLYGYWSFEGVTWLNITRDTIYFVDEEAFPVKYSANNDTIVWYFDGIIQKSKYKVAQDTLFMENEEGSVTYIRVNDEK